MSFTLWGSISSLFYASSGSVSGALWQRSNWTLTNGDTIWLDSETAASSYSSTVASSYTIDLTTEDWTGATQVMIPVATETTVNPFGKKGNLAGIWTYSQTSTSTSGGLYWFAPSTTSGTFNILYQGFSSTAETSPSSGPSTTLTGSPTTIVSGIANPTAWDSNWSSSNLVLGWSTAVTATTENIYFQAFNTSGASTTSAVEVAAGVDDGTQWYVGENNSKFFYDYTVVNGSSTGLYDESFSPTTGAVGSPTLVLSQPSYTAYFNIASQAFSGGNLLKFTEGMSSGQHVLQVTAINSSGVAQSPATTFTLSGNTADHWGKVGGIYDPTDNAYDYTAIAYTDNNQVHLELVDQNGAQIGSDFVVAGLTSFDRITDLGSRVEIDYSTVDGSGNNIEAAYIYDTATAGRNSTLSGSSEWVGTPFNDVFTDAAGTYYINGGGGSDELIVNYAASAVTLSVNGSGDVVVTTPNSSDTLHGFSTIKLLNETVSISGSTLTTKYSVADASDFNGDGFSDVLFRNGSGTSYLWEMNGATVTNGATTSVQVGNNWQIEGIGDFNGDGSADILWVYNNTSNSSDSLNGVSYVSTQSGPTATSGSGVVEQLSTVWQVAGIGDFNGDGMSDVMYRNSSTGQTYVNQMNGSQINWSASGFTSSQVTDANWQVAAVADFNGDGKADILWRYDNSANASDPLNGSLYEWQMNGTTVTSAGLLSQQAGSANWQVQGTGDFDGNGTADILFRYENSANSSDPLNGTTYIDFMNGSTVTSGAPTQWQIDNSWVVAGIGDYNGDGKSDILWQQTSTGNTYVWEMNGATVTAGSSTSQQAGLGWTPQNGVHIA